MKLYILRHGIAAEAGSGQARIADSRRPLTPKGEKKTWKAAEAIEAMKMEFDVILSSPYLRARQTAEIVAQAFNIEDRVRLTRALMPSGSCKAVLAEIERIRPKPASVLLVGHEPFLSRLVLLLTCGDESGRITLKKGGLCRLSTGALALGRCASLDWLLTPKQMGLMA